jgi:hypothetical protein
VLFADQTAVLNFGQLRKLGAKVAGKDVYQGERTRRYCKASTQASQHGDGAPSTLSVGAHSDNLAARRTARSPVYTRRHSSTTLIAR